MSDSLVDAQAISFPTLTWQHAMVLLYHHEEGRRTRDRMVSWGAMIQAMHDRHGFTAFDAATFLRDKAQPPLLLYERGKFAANVHRLPEICFRDPVPLFDAINAVCRDTGKPEHPIPSSVETLGYGGGGQQAQGASGYGYGSIVPTPNGPAEIVRGEDGRPAFRLLSSLPAVGESPDITPSNPMRARVLTPAAQVVDGEEGAEVPENTRPDTKSSRKGSASLVGAKKRKKPVRDGEAKFDPIQFPNGMKQIMKELKSKGRASHEVR